MSNTEYRVIPNEIPCLGLYPLLIAQKMSLISLPRYMISVSVTCVCTDAEHVTISYSGKKKQCRAVQSLAKCLNVDRILQEFFQVNSL